MINYFNGGNLLSHLCALAWASTFPTDVTLNEFGIFSIQSFNNDKLCLLFHSDKNFSSTSVFN